MSEHFDNLEGNPDPGPTPEEERAAWERFENPSGTIEVHVGQSVYVVVNDPDDSDHGLRIGVD